MDAEDDSVQVDAHGAAVPFDVEVGTEAVWAAADAHNRPRLLLVNKMDRENVRVRRVLESVNGNLAGHFVQLQLPIGEGPGFKGVVDLLSMEARLGEKGDRAPIPADMAAKAEQLGVTKAHLPLRRLVPLGVLAGAFIALGANFSTVVTAGAGKEPQRQEGAGDGHGVPEPW